MRSLACRPLRPLSLPQVEALCDFDSGAASSIAIFAWATSSLSMLSMRERASLRLFLACSVCAGRHRRVALRLDASLTYQARRRWSTQAFLGSEMEVIEYYLNWVLSF